MRGTRISCQLSGNKTTFARSTFRESARRPVLASATVMRNRRRRIMKTLITALAFAIVILAPGLTEPADARVAAR